MTPGNEQLREALATVMDRSDHFGHRQHLHLAWIALQSQPADAGSLLAEWLLQIATAKGAPGRFHRTRTVAWTHLTSFHLEGDSISDGFNGFLERNPGLLDSAILDRHWSTSLLESEAARRGWVEPDLRPLPEVASHG